jgi:hypothetical protein
MQSSGAVIAIEAELSPKRAVDLSENLMELVRGAGYLHLKAEHGVCGNLDVCINSVDVGHIPW